MGTALGLGDKAKNSKSLKDQMKYLLEAQEILERGLALNDVGYANIKSVHSSVMEHIKAGKKLLGEE